MTVTASAAPRSAPTACPEMIASTAAIPPSVATIGMTTPICPMRSAW